ncbi:hypothetical protein FA95DRAFT_1600646 [Auriscalpium vulgare]|uniref:Uncharacterized protein n=1 Tax=Auriscalpium vulgare TaxID=40419 RepID=A0ACB8SE36_9AGAM|nr:hypothetical protein FA95DRAFT_1600646 [Auriscalpium vulgare]
MPPRPPKRSATSAEAGPSRPPIKKKTRILDPADDPAHFADEVDAALENPSAARKGRVKTDGYDSDSSDDGEGVVPSRRPGGDAAAEEDEDDMFAAAEKEDKKQEDTGKKKEEFLRLGDIEGQEFGGESGSESSAEEGEPEDEDDAARRAKAGMGFELSSFNMREEMEEGKFSADGMYVRTFDPHAVHDRWMDGLDEREIKRARRRKREQEREQRERQRAEERELEELGGRDAVEREVLGLLKKGETVLEALQRLGAQAKKNRKNEKGASARKAQPPPVDGAMEVDKPPTAAKETSDIDQLTHLASTLMSLGDTDIYSKTYEELVRSVRAAGKVDSSWVPPSADVKYEYKWDVLGATQDGQVFGPFGEEEMQAWYNASYFGAAGEKVKVRKVGGEWGGWDDFE